MSACNCGRVDLPIGTSAWSAGDIVHGVTGCWSGGSETKSAIERVREACKAKQGPRAHDDPYNRGWDAALTWVERSLDGPQ